MSIYPFSCLSLIEVNEEKKRKTIRKYRTFQASSICFGANSKDTTSNLGWRIVLRYAKVVILCEFHWSSPGSHSVPKSAKLCADLNAEFDRWSRWVTVGTNSSPNSSHKRGTQFGTQLGTLILYPAPYPTLLRKGHNVFQIGCIFSFHLWASSIPYLALYSAKLYSDSGG